MTSSVRHDPEHKPNGCFLVCASLGDVKGRWEPWPSPAPVQPFLWLLEKSRKRRRKRGALNIDHARKHKIEEKRRVELMLPQSFGGRRQGRCSLCKLHQAEFPKTCFYASQRLQRPFPAPPSCPKAAVIHRVSRPFPPSTRTAEAAPNYGARQMERSEPLSKIARLHGK